MTIRNHSSHQFNSAVTRLVVCTIVAGNLWAPQVAWALLDTIQANTSGVIPINGLSWIKSQVQLESHLRSLGLSFPVVPIDQLPTDMAAAARQLLQVAGAINGNGGSPASHLQTAGNRIATLFAPGQPNAVSPRQMQAFSATLPNTVKDIQALQTSLSKMFPVGGKLNVAEMEAAMKAAARSRNSLLAFVKVLQTFPSTGTPEQTVAMADFVALLKNASSAIEQTVPALKGFVPPLQK